MHLGEKKLNELIEFLEGHMESTKPEGVHGGVSSWDGNEDKQHKQEGKHTAYRNTYVCLSSLLLEQGEETGFRTMTNFLRRLQGLNEPWPEKP